MVPKGLTTYTIRLAEVLVHLMPKEIEVWGLLALMLFHNSRFDSRIGGDGEIIDLESQDRGLWDRDLIARGDKLLSAALMKARPVVTSYRRQSAQSTSMLIVLRQPTGSRS